MPFTFTPIREAEARQIALWRYEGAYAFYNGDAEDIEQIEASVQSYLNPAYHYYSMRNESAELIGYCCFGEDARVTGGDYSGNDREEALDVGVGMRPDLTGQGHGTAFMAAILDFARHHFAPHTFRVTIASWNNRALRLAQKAGFQPEATFISPSGTEFTILTRKATIKF
ncbi:MAG: GNAT family N-acetyltransferase [Ardenticatenaceae bacterium]